MSATRQSIDRKLDALSVQTAAAKQDALRRAWTAAMFAAAAVLMWRWWRQRAHA